jgi:subtilisin family serine protease
MPTPSEPAASQSPATYYYSGGKRIELVREPRAFAVKYAPQATSSATALPRDVSRLLFEDARSPDFVPSYGLQIFVAPERSRFETPAGADAQLAELNEAPGVAYATPVFRQTPQSRQPMYVTNRLLVKFKPDVSPEDRAALHARLGGEVVEALGYADDAYLVEVRGRTAGQIVAIANAYYESGLAEWAHPDFIRSMEPKTVQPRFVEDEKQGAAGAAAMRGEAEDWHIRLARVDRAWSMTRGSPSVRIAVIDDGVDIDHPEFQGRVVAHHDFADAVANGRPKKDWDNHGTACASVALAAGRRALGAAPGCSLMAIRMARFASSDEARMFQWVADQGASVISCSWGPTDGEGPFPLPDATQAAMDYCVDRGRGGKGIPIFFAAGNGNEPVAGDGYASYSRVMAIAASTSEDTRAPYSDYGPEIWIAAPSSGGARRVFTADRMGAAGYNPEKGGPADSQDYFERFGGTSSATPLVAGVAALMISADPAITERRIREILRTSADRIGDGTSYDGAGHSPQFGYGRLNAERALQTVRSGSGSGTGTNTGAPSIRGPDRMSRTDPAPSFQIEPAGRRAYAVEVATRAELFDTGRFGSARTDSNFFASWQTGLSAHTPYTLPDDVWRRLSAADALYYRAHVADDASWSNYAVTTPDADAARAPHIALGSASGTGSGTTSGTGTSGGGGADPRAVAITAPARVGRDGPPPVLTVVTGGRPLYAVEITSRPELFAAPDNTRDPGAFFASWREGLSSVAPFTVPESAWNRLRGAPRLFYRLHAAADPNWNDYAVTTPDADWARAPSFELVAGAGTGAGGTGAGTGTGGTGAGTGAGGASADLVFPSGARFAAIVPAPAGFDDPVGGGRVAVIAVRGRTDTRLSANFTLGEFVSPGLSHARVSPELVRCLQALRGRLGAPLTVVRGYAQPPGGGAGDQHVAGWAARISSRSADPVRLATLALESAGVGISLGLGRDALEIDLRPEPVVWVEPGAAMSLGAFQDLVARSGARAALRGPAPGMTVTATRALTVGDPAPDFLIEAGGARFVALELATDPRAFFERGRRAADTFWASWFSGLAPVDDDRCVLHVDAEAWHRLSQAPHVYYRAVGAHAPDGRWRGFRTSLRAEAIAAAPRIAVAHPSARSEPLGVEFGLRPRLLHLDEAAESRTEPPATLAAE